MPKTKIVCTIGPASDSMDKLKALMKAGMNVARLNFSHGNHAEHAERISRIREAARAIEHTVAILLDTKGPEIRTGILAQDEVQLREGNTLTLTTDDVMGDASRVSISYKGLPEDVKPGDTLLIDDGLIGLKVQEVKGTDIVCLVEYGGILKEHKGVNAPGVSIRLPGMTEKDAADIRFGVELGVDFIAASFVRTADDVLAIRELLEEMRADLPIIAKIESRQSVENLTDILEVSDGIMVARGDLGVEIPVEEVPLLQKQMIRQCNQVGKPVITATQMLDSMQRHPRPTRAEASDVANAIIDGTDAVMLSGETASGKYPLEAVQMMAKIAERTESSLHYREELRSRSIHHLMNMPGVISQSVANASLHLNAAAIIAPTESGYTARMIAKYRPECPIIAVTYQEKTQRRLSLSWGVVPLVCEKAGSIDEMLSNAVETALEAGAINYGDLVVISAGVPVGQIGTTNMMKIHVVGDILANGQGIGHQVVTGKVVIGSDDLDSLMAKMTPGSILVVRSTDKDMMPAFHQASAVIAEEGGLTSHTAIVGLNLGIPVIVGVADATEILAEGMEITVDTERGYIYSGRAKVL